jgi:predicted ATPase
VKPPADTTRPAEYPRKVCSRPCAGEAASPTMAQSDRPLEPVSTGFLHINCQSGRLIVHLDGSVTSMLLEFRVQNHRSLRDEQAISLEPARGDSASPDSERKALPVVAIYGANASGKSNLLAALAYMQQAVSLSHRMWDPEEGVPRDPFAWGSEPQKTSLYEVAFSLQGVRYEYGFVADDDCFQEEWLYAWPKGRKQTWFTRDANVFDFGDHLKGENRVVQQVTRPNALFLSAAVQHHHGQLLPIYDWFKRLTSVNVPRRGRGRLTAPHDYWLRHLLSNRADVEQLTFSGTDDGEDGLEMLRRLLRAADVGITDLKLVDDAEDNEPRMSRRSRVFMKHQNSSKEAWLPLEEESHGTRTLVRFAQPILRTLRQGGILFVDELEASLHPLLAALIVKQFNDPETNPMNGQLLFTTHDTNLLGTTLGSPLLTRDQVWLTEKDNDGATCVYALSNYKPRKVENLERGYLQGRYGAIPFLGELVLSAK